MKGEIWKPIKGYEGIYEISNKGRVKSLARLQKKAKATFVSKEKILKTRWHNGYEIVNLYKKNNEKETELIHRLVATTFIKNPNNLPCVNHKNGIKADNYVENLEWCTYSYNNNHARQNDLVKPNITGLLKTNEITSNEYLVKKDNKIICQMKSSKKVAKYLIENNLLDNKNVNNLSRAIRRYSLTSKTYKGLTIDRINTGIDIKEKDEELYILKDKNIIHICKNSIEAADYIIKLDGSWNAQRRTIERSIRKAIKENKKYHNFTFKKM